MHIGIGTKEVHFHYNLLTFDITFVFYDGIAIDAHDVRTCPQRRYEATSEDVT
jgi:hypothetical protein